MNNTLTAVLFAATVAFTSAYSLEQLSEMSLKSVMDMSNLRHNKIPEHLLLSSEGKPVVGAERVKLLQGLNSQFPELILAEDFAMGFINGSSFTGNPQCQGALNGMVYYAFDLINHSQITNPSNSIKALIATQKLATQQSLFYAYCDFSHLYMIIGKLMQFNDMMQYGQLASRVMGMAVGGSLTSSITCITDGVSFVNGNDFVDVGRCIGQLLTQILDSSM